MKTPKMVGPSQAEIDLQQQQQQDIAKRNAQLDAEEAARRKKAEDQAAAVANNRVGLRALLSNGWLGFSRTGDGTDLEAR